MKSKGYVYGVVSAGAVFLIASAGLAPAPVTAQEASVLEEITVTARRREESLQEIPISIIALTSDEIAQLGAATLADITTAVPNLYFQDRGSNLGNFGIRGIVTAVGNVGIESATAIYIDGVPVGRPEAFDAALNDVAQIEVLRGPQGTLFGKNTIAGAINIITKRPTKEFSADLKLEAGNFGRTQFGGVVNLPIGDTSAFRVSVTVTEQDGWIDNINDGREFNGEDDIQARIQFQSNPNDKLQIYWAADFFEDSRNFIAQIHDDPREFKTHPQQNIYEGIVDIDSPSTSDRDLWGTSLEINYTTDNDITFTSVTGFREQDTLSIFDQDSSRQRLSENTRDGHVETLSQEFRLTGSTERVNWTAGAYFSSQDIDESTQTRFFPQNILVGCNVPVTPQFFRGQPPPPPFEPTARDAGHDAQFLPIWDFDLNSNGVFNEPNVTIPPLGLFGANEDVGCNNPDLIAFGRHLAGGDAMDWYVVGDPALGFDSPLSAATVPEVAQVHEFGFLNTDTVALFGHADIDLTERGTLSLGIRFTEEDKDLSMTQDGMVNIQRASFATTDSRSDSETSGTIGYSFRFTDNVMGYAKASRGFKSGGYTFSITQGENVSAFAGWFRTNAMGFLAANPGATKADLINAAIAGSADPNQAPAGIAFDTETADSFEIGLKSELLNNRLRLNFAAFATEYDNFQQNIVRLATGITVQNVPGVEINGYEVDFTALITERLTIQGGLGYAESKITEAFILTNPQNPLAPLVDSSAFVNQRLANAPEHTGNLTVMYEFPVGNGRLLLRGDFSHVGSVLHALVEDGQGLEALLTEPSYDVINARVSYVANDGDWELSFWGKNIGNERYAAWRGVNPIMRVFGLNSAGVGLAFPGSETAQSIAAMPEVYGVTYTKRFQ